MSSLSAIVGLAAIAAVFFVITQFGEQFGKGAAGVSKGVSQLLSPSIVPTFGFQTDVPQWLSDLLGGARKTPEEYLTDPSLPEWYREGTRTEDRNNGINGLPSPLDILAPRPEARRGISEGGLGRIDISTLTPVPSSQVVPIGSRPEDRLKLLGMNGGGAR